MPPPYQVGILTVSDTASADASTDKTGSLLSSLFTSDSRTWSEPVKAIVPDDVTSIQAQLLKWSSSGVNLAVTTGGTGFSARDVTPEAVQPLLAKEAYGLRHVMMSASLQKTHMAALARPVAGTTKDGMVIITVPGSPKGAKENVEALLGVLPHALDLAGGGSGKEVHKSMGMPERDAASNSLHAPAPSHSHSHAHDHYHHHHSAHGHHAPTPRTIRSMDISKGASARQRQSPYPIISLQEAYDHIFSNTPILRIETRSVGADLAGYILAEDVYSEMDLPSTMTTNVDGYAVRAEATPAGVYPVLTSSTYSTDPDASILNAPLPAGHIYRINTGAPLPKGADAVIMVEDTELVSAFPTNNKEEKEVELLTAVPKGENVRQPGSDVKKGEKVLEKGTRISEVGGEIGTLAFIGRREVKVYRKPRVAIMSTGNEITELLSSPSRDAQSKALEGPVIFDSNRPSLAACLNAYDIKVHDLRIVKDEEKEHIDTIQEAIDNNDILITTGGTSMGESDLLKPVIERSFGGTIHFGRVAMKPGKPTTFASIPASYHSSKGKSSDGPENPTLVFALPGNPASALVTFHLFVAPCLRKMSGYPSNSWHLPKVRVQTDSTMRLDPRPEFHRVWVESTQEPPYLVARSTGGQRSSRTVSLANANALVCLPSSNDVKEGDKKSVEKGQMVDAILIGKLG